MALLFSLPFHLLCPLYCESNSNSLALKCSFQRPCKGSFPYYLHRPHGNIKCCRLKK
ncbi:unnamed protein product [Nyctereutes procyonoides]|uniref:(raccoon dog) hypothetical protein n=1 Tax=Nyctereutes procyonoides TaxID=34880 RepID=A0A811ZZ87_NYCPR|nr:unnamed protein product [Nyctereutes procyonoides]